MTSQKKCAIIIYSSTLNNRPNHKSAHTKSRIQIFQYTLVVGGYRHIYNVIFPIMSGVPNKFSSHCITHKLICEPENE